MDNSAISDLSFVSLKGGADLSENTEQLENKLKAIFNNVKQAGGKKKDDSSSSESASSVSSSSSGSSSSSNSSGSSSSSDSQRGGGCDMNGGKAPSYGFKIWRKILDYVKNSVGKGKKLSESMKIAKKYYDKAKSGDAKDKKYSESEYDELFEKVKKEINKDK